VSRNRTVGCFHLPFGRSLGAVDVPVTPEIRWLRRLLYCGEWIESHGLHIYLLHAPDFLGFESGISLAAKHWDIVEKGLRLKKIGNQLLEVLGGRAIRPINNGCHLDRNIRELVATQPFCSVAVEEFYRERTPKTHGYMYRGIATK
jgi:hypothetical protein